MAGKDPEIKAVPSSTTASDKPYDPIKLNIEMKEKDASKTNTNYNVI